LPPKCGFVFFNTFVITGGKDSIFLLQKKLFCFFLVANLRRKFRFLVTTCCANYAEQIVYLHKLLGMNIADNLKILRNRSKLSQQEVADQLGVDRNTYSNWEKGSNNIKSEFIPPLAKVFGVDIGTLFKEKKSEIVINQTNENNHDNSINGIVLLLTDKDSVDRLVEVLKEKMDR
jgi:transcriptional regulator with XRE-family HTH domain